MNNLSWFIYLTQVVDGVRDASSAFLVTSLIAAGAMLVFAPIIAGVMLDGAIPDGVKTLARKVAKSWAILLFLCIATYLVTPSRQTMLLIAGSEMGERIVKSDAVKDIVNPGADLLKAWIKDETDKITNKKK